MTSVALKTPLKTRLLICIYKTSLPHRPDDYIGFTSSCPPHILQQNCAHECNSKVIFENDNIERFYQYVGPAYPQIKELASKTMSMFATIFVCKQLFSLMKSNKPRSCFQLTDAHLNSTLKVATTHSLVPDINMLVTAKRCQVSSSRSAMNKW